MRPIPPEEMNTLREYQNHYLSVRHPYLKLDPKSKSTLKELIDFWTGELDGLKLENPKTDYMAGISPYIATNVPATIARNSEIAYYKEMAEKGLTNVQRTIRKYSVKALEGK